MSARQADLDGLLALTERELLFLTTNLEDHPEIAATPAGALLLTCLEGGMAMARRLHEIHKLTEGSDRS